MKLRAFSFFHLNLAYSAISEDRRQEVIRRCYWPLLRLAKSKRLPFGIEASAWTLEVINSIDPDWVGELRDLVNNGPCEFIGCGYTQLIGPLVPAQVNEANLRIGMHRYEQLLGSRPKIALVNEQAYSVGLIPIYLEAGFDALIMEWNNPARSHPEWDPEWRYLPQYARSAFGAEIPLIWNKSVAFQKVQRYVHGDIELDEYLNYVQSHVGASIRGFPIYGNDVEVFDFRPGRYMTEAKVHKSGEWQRMEAMYEALQSHPDIEMVAPSEILSMLIYPGAGNRLSLETPDQPIPVKKQEKYNILRWAVSGRDDLFVNTMCWRLFDAFIKNGAVNDEGWAELCYLWSSDFRTHTDEARWLRYREHIDRLASEWGVSKYSLPPIFDAIGDQYCDEKKFRVSKKGRFLITEGRRFKISFNCSRGLALESFVDLNVGEKSLCGTIHHGHYDDIKWAADFYTGHLVYEAPGKPKITDLSPVEPKVSWDGDILCISGSVDTLLGRVEKCWRIDEKSGFLILRYRLSWPQIELGCLRLGHITLNPEKFSQASLSYSTHNGGRFLESFGLSGLDFDHGAPVSFLVSANNAVGLTTGQIIIGDNQSGLNIKVDKKLSAAVGLVTHRQVDKSYFSRVAFTLSEMDDTSRSHGNQVIDFEMVIEPLTFRSNC